MIEVLWPLTIFIALVIGSVVGYCIGSHDGDVNG